jgi:hypothetical protein
MTQEERFGDGGGGGGGTPMTSKVRKALVGKPRPKTPIADQRQSCG